MTGPTRARYKVCVLGAPGCGKTSLVRRFAQGSFTESQRQRGIDFYSCNVQLRDDVSVALQLWDVSDSPTSPGQDPAPLAPYLYNAQACLLVYDATDPQSLDDLAHVLAAVEAVCAANSASSPMGGAQPYLALVATKCDLQPAAAEMDTAARQLAARHGCTRFATSAKTGVGAERTLVQLSCDLAGVPLTATPLWSKLQFDEQAGFKDLTSLQWDEQQPAAAKQRGHSATGHHHLSPDPHLDSMVLNARAMPYSAGSGTSNCTSQHPLAAAALPPGATHAPGGAFSYVTGVRESQERTGSQSWRPVSRSSTSSPTAMLISKSGPLGQHRPSSRAGSPPRSTSPLAPNAGLGSGGTGRASGFAAAAAAAAVRASSSSGGGQGAAGAGPGGPVTRSRRGSWRGMCCCG